MTLTKSDIIENLANNDLTRKKAGELLEELLEVLKSRLEKGEDMLISGFGKFCVKNKKQRRGRNPATGDDLILDARKVITFNCSPVLRDRIN
jgi:integration host factor subunit alpha